MSTSSTPLSRPPRADSERNRRLLLHAGAEVFAARGGEATLNDIARAAGVGVGTAYRKFPDKEAVLDALVGDKIDALVGLANAASENKDPGKAFREFLERLMEARATDRGLDAILTSPERQTQFSDELERRLLPTVAQLIALATEAGQVRPGISADEVCLLAFMVGKVADITGPDDPQLWRRYAQVVIDGTRQQPGLEPLAPKAIPFAAAATALGRAG